VRPSSGGPHAATIGLVTRRLLLAFAVALTGAVAVVAAVVLAAGGDGDDPGPASSPAPARASAPVVPNLDECARVGDDLARQCYTDAFVAMVRGRGDPRPAVAAIADAAWKEGAGLLSDCHGIMHTVGRRYAQESGLELGTLMGVLPQSNDPGCSAGFAHGMVTAVAPDIDPSRPGEAARVCGDAGTRYQEYSCVHGFGHAFMRVYGSRVDAALDLCSGLGATAAPDCAQGAYHDYWFAMAGYDGTEPPEEAVRDPRVLCGRAPAQFVRPCWYRAWVENRPEAFAVATPEDLDALCYRLEGLQRSACITGAAVIGPPDPAEQLALCARLAVEADAIACVRGTKVQNLLREPPEALVDLVERCDGFGAARVGTACRRWLGKAIAVLTDGAFARDGCARLPTARARRDCAAGAGSMDTALETFS
jgi:hypothetical protein